MDGERGGLDAGFLGVGGVVDLGGVAVPLRPAEVYALQALGPVRRVRAAGLCVDRDQRLAGVVLPRQQGPDLQLIDLGAQGRELGGCLYPGGLVVLALGQLEHDPGVVEPPP